MENTQRIENENQYQEVYTVTELFNIDVTTFAAALTRLKTVVERRNTMPILSNVLIECDNAKISLSGTDLEVTKRIVLDHNAFLSPGTITASLKKLLEILNAIKARNKAEKITFGIDSNNWITLKYGNNQYKLVALPPDEYPALPGTDLKAIDKTASISAPELLPVLTRLLPAISTEESRVNLNGVFFDKKEKFNIVATDGHRLHLERDFIALSSAPVIVPRKGIKEIINAIKKEKGLVHFYHKMNVKHTENFSGAAEVKISASHLLHVLVNEDLLSIRLIDESYPNYDQVIPSSEYAFNYTVKVAALIDLLKQASLLSTERYKGVKISILPDTLTVTSNNSEFGEFTGGIDLIDHNNENTAFDAVTIGLNAQYIIEYAAKLPKDALVTLMVRDATTQVLLTSDDVPGYEAVIMPMRL
jgi:DNA polymerase-3 subunit beta